MYNIGYIEAFKENRYDKLLSSPTSLSILFDKWFRQYQDDADTEFLALKESLDHYVAKRLSEDKNYYRSVYFQNYYQYLIDLVNKRVVKNKNGDLYLELSINPVFDYLSDDVLNELSPENNIRKLQDYNQSTIDLLINKIKNGESIHPKAVEFLAEYFDNRKDFSDERYSIFIGYVFSNLNKMKSTPRLISSVLTFLPSTYNLVTDSRCFMGGTDGFYNGKIKPIDVAHSSGKYPYTAYQMSHFKKISMNSFKSVNSSRTFKENDILFLIFVTYHELSHQLQNKKMARMDTFDGAAKEINRYVNVVHNDYRVNHDSDETEIDADQRGWLMAGRFASRYIKDNDLAFKCRKNAEAVNCRRAFAVKKTPSGLRRYMDLDMELLIDSIKKRPELLSSYPHLSELFNKNGTIKTDYFFNNKIICTPSGREVMNYTLNNASISMFVSKIGSGNYSIDQVRTLLSNFVEVPHENALTLRKLKDTDLSTYDETYSNIDIKTRAENVYGFYFLEVCEQLEKFAVLLTATHKNYPEFTTEEVSSYFRFFIDYYVEMLKNISVPDMKRIDEKMQKFENSGYPIIRKLAEQTRVYLNNRFGRRQDVIINDDMMSDIHSDELDQMFISVSVPDVVSKGYVA